MVTKSQTLVFVTHNKHKISEVSAITGSDISVLGMADFNFFEEIPETAETLEGNALQKARYFHSRFHCNCFADDTGLEVEALGGRPGVYSARYAGEHATYSQNVEKLLDEMRGVENRRARFVTVVALILDGREYLFEGEIMGEITRTPSGSSGFGYDPVFKPDLSDKTFAELGEDEKNRCSHRGIALRKMITFLKNR